MASSDGEDIINRLDGCTNSFGCFDESRFVKSPSRNYICAVGKGVFKNPKIVPCCRNAFCEQCIKKCRPPHYREQESTSYDINELQCPLCKDTFDSRQLEDVSLNFKNEVKELHIKCSFEECKEERKLEDILYHEVRCEWNPEREVTCPDCNKKLRHSTMKDHYCHERVSRKMDDLEKKNEELRQEGAKQDRIIEEMLKI